MLLLILLAGCLASCAAQTTSFATTASTTTTAAPFIQSTAVMNSTSADNNNVFAILETAVRSSFELNETTLNPVLSKIQDMIREFQADLDVTLTVKNITKV